MTSSHKSSGENSSSRPAKMGQPAADPASTNEPHAPTQWPDGLLLGRTATPRAFGFSAPDTNSPVPCGPEDHIRADGHGVLMAATGEGKFTTSIAGNVLAFGGSQLLVVDPKGEIAAVTARAGRARGDVYIVDPFEVLGSETASFNPLDLVQLPGMAIEDTADAIARELSVGKGFDRDPFWHEWAVSVIGGVIASVSQDPDPSNRTLNKVVDMLTAEDVVYALAVAMDKGQIRGDFAKRRIASFLQLPDGGGSTRGGVLGSIQHLLAFLMGPRIRRCLGPSSFDLKDLVTGDRPITLYLIFPPTRLAYAGLLRLWMATLLHTLCARPSMPERSTLIVVDEAANLGKLDLLPIIYSYGRGMRVTMLTAWQSLGQMMSVFPTEWRTIVENANIQCFGLHTTAVDPMAQLLGVSPQVLRGLRPNEQLVTRAGREPEVLGRIDYRTDPVLAALADPNPRYARRQGSAMGTASHSPSGDLGRGP
jgi:type IV secretion system protein VirD4